MRARLSEAEAARDHRAATLRFLDAVEQVNRVMRAARTVDELLVGVLDEMLDIFDCDRAWLLRPCDPDAPSWSVPMERTRPEWPGSFARGVELPMEEGARRVFNEALAADEPVEYVTGGERPVPPEVAALFRIKSQLVMAVHPKTDVPWLLGVHHCARRHRFTEEERSIFRGICHRVGDSLSTLISLRDLAESERRFRTLVENAPDAIVVLDEACRFVDANENAARLLRTDIPTLLTRTMADMSPDQQPDGSSSSSAAAGWIARSLGGEACRFEWALEDSTGRAITTEFRLIALDHSARLVRGSIVEIGERLALERQVRHLQKMEAVGELAGGVAHDFNNQLVVILGYASMLMELPGASPRGRELTGRIAHAAEQAAVVTRQLLAFSRRSTLAPRVVDLSDAVRIMLPLLERVVGSPISLTLEPSPTPALARVDPAQLEQVIMNLVTNARDALPKGGHICITTSVAEPGDDPAHDVPEGPLVALSVQDNGVGMDPTVAARVFEPFFTTKELGRGTGLGLSTAYGVIRQSGGTILVQSAKGGGTTFTVLLPRTEGEVAPTLETVQKKREIPTGTASILLVEDNWAVGEVAQQILADNGYQVRVARDGFRALEDLSTGARFDLLLTDLVMPGMDGVELAGRAKAQRPGLRVLYSTGYGAGAIDRLAEATDPEDVLQKPYTAVQLLESVRRALKRGIER